MKYLYLIIRHFFPRKHWKIIKETTIYGMDEFGQRRPLRLEYTLQNQFGEIKTFKK
jgi:hypothetical protein